MPNFSELQKLEKETHVILYFCDLWAYITNNINNQNVKDFLGFLLQSRRMDFSIIFEFHSWPFGLSKQINQFFSMYLANSTLIFVTKSISDMSKIELFKHRYLKNYIENFEKAQKLSQDIIDKSKNNNQRSYVCLQKDISQKHRLLRVDLFNENIINILD